MSEDCAAGTGDLPGLHKVPAAVGSAGNAPRVPRLALAKMRVTLRALSGGRVPRYLGSTLRGTFGHAFKSIGCGLHGPCGGPCQAPRHCAYSYLFETPMPDELRGRLGNEYAPHPFVLCPLEHTEGRVVRGQPIAFSITTFGRGISYFPFLLAAFEELGKRGLGADRIPFRLEAVTDSLHENSRLLFDPAEHRVLGSPAVRDLRKMAESAARERIVQSEGSVDVRVRFLSPTHLVRGGQALREPDLDALLAALHRRLEAFTLLHGEGPVAWDDSPAKDPPDPETLGWERARVSVGAEPLGEFGFTVAVLPWEWDPGRGTRVGDSRGLRETAAAVQSDTTRLQWVDWDRLSNRQGRHVPMGGVIGDAIYRRVPIGCLPWLMAGQWILAGKATVFGMGRYLADIEPPAPT